jgi:hypothetical protein
MTLNPEGEKCMLSYDGSCVINSEVEELRERVRNETDKDEKKLGVAQLVDGNLKKFTPRTIDLYKVVSGSACGSCRWGK